MESCSARESGRRFSEVRISRIAAGLASERRLFTRVLRFCEKHNFTKSRKRDSSARRSFARSPGKRSVTRAEVTWRWRESVARKFKNKFGARIELREDGEIAVVSRARLRGEACRDLGLNDDVNFVDE